MGNGGDRRQHLAEGNGQCSRPHYFVWDKVCQVDWPNADPLGRRHYLTVVWFTIKKLFDSKLQNDKIPARQCCFCIYMFYGVVGVGHTEQ